jgi:uncharacterized protein (TIGR02300 family)
MKKASLKEAAPVSLGTKRTCPDCGAKFYDFNKSELVCPKCESQIDLDTLQAKLLSTKSSDKKAKPAKEVTEDALMEAEDVVVSPESEEFESLEDLEDDDEDVDVTVPDGESEDY